ncbi:MAG: aspartate aminotransferase family protein [Bacteroidetes bacterium]|nr:aspartate aminotransferase family protein [Bacteroidota bacterium]MCL6099973.1 aspartate aminotransferase family protein [Bacteroidota bacterium]
MIDYKEITQKYEIDVYPRRDVVLVKGKGARLWDDNGNEYIDMAAGISVANIGHSNEKVVEALTKQASTLITCPNTFYNDTKAIFLEKLFSIAPKNLTKAFLTNSGTEAIEGAIKFVRLNTKKTKFIAAMKGFHGRTLGALSATYKKEYREGFEPLVPGFTFVPYNNFEKLAEAVDDDTAGIILEPIQGEGGINVGQKEYFQKVRQLCDEKNILLIIDEIQTGFCRTGKMFAIENLGIEADIMTLAKSIAGGFPMGAILCSDKIQVEKSKHGSTFGGNPLACAAGIASIDFMIENKLWEQAEAKGKYFKEKLEKLNLSKVREIRIVGLMIGIELKDKSQPVIVELLNKGIISLPAGTTVLRMLPPLVISYEDLDTVVEKLAEILK